MTDLLDDPEAQAGNIVPAGVALVSFGFQEWPPPEGEASNHSNLCLCTAVRNDADLKVAELLAELAKGRTVKMTQMGITMHHHVHR